ncbi:ComEC/Rec2 family competence protein, partial [Candidatus Zixiibacteriota bacterium]
FIAGFTQLSKESKISVAILFGLTICFFSSFHFSIKHYDTGINNISNFTDNSHKFHIYGSVTDWPDLKVDRTEIKLSVDSLQLERIYYTTGNIIIYLSDTTTKIQRGDRLEFYSRISPVRGGGISSTFNYQRYLNLKNVFGAVYLSTLLDVRIDKTNRLGVFNIVDKIRNQIRNCFYTNLSPSSAALASGFLIGETRDIPNEVYRNFKDSGTLHLLAVSGSNVALVLFFFILLMRPFSISRGKIAIILLGAVILFNLLSYGEPSVLRASVMATLVIVAGIVQRRYNLNNIIAFAALFILIYEPSQLYDVGFQLSFVIAWGLIFSLPPLTHLFDRYKNRYWYRWLVFPLLVAIVAQVYSIGLIALYFNQIPIISPIANLIIIPFVSAAVVGIMILLGASLVHPLLGSLFGSWLNLLLEIILKIVNFFGSDTIPLIKLSEVSGLLIGILYLMLVLGVFSITMIKLRRYVLILALLVLNLILIPKIYNSIIVTDQIVIDFFRIPGGIISVNRDKDNSHVDLVITGMSAKKYPMDEKIIIPNLQRLNIDNIENIFLLSADYNALDDLIRLVNIYKAQNLYLCKDYYNSVLEIINNQIPVSDSFRIIPAKGVRGNYDSDGYYAYKSGLLFKKGNYYLIYNDRYTEELTTTIPDNTINLLILGTSWNLSSNDKIQMINLDFNKIICSKFEQSEFEDGIESNELIDSRLSKVLVDLYFNDYYRLKITDCD